MRSLGLAQSGIGYSLWRLVLVALFVGLVGVAQSSAQTVTAVTQQDAPAQSEAAPDLEAWERFATTSENLVANPATPTAELESLRSKVAAWRETLLSAQNTNSVRVNSIRSQIEALGSPPEDGQTEAEEIAKRRAALNEQLTTLQAPSIAATEAYSQADSIVRDIDRVVRERQAAELLRLAPAPINPSNWPVALRTVTQKTSSLWNELASGWTQTAKRKTLIDNLPSILGLVLLAGFLILRGRVWIENFAVKIHQKTSSRGRIIWSLIASLGQIIVPTLGMLAISTALIVSGILGPTGLLLAVSLAPIGFIVFSALWLGGQVFQKAADSQTLLKLNQELRAEGRLYVFLLGLVLAVEEMRNVLFPSAEVPEAADSVLAFPTVAVAGLLLFRLSQLLMRHVKDETADAEPTSFRNRLIGMAARGAMAIAVVGPVLAAFGYVAAGTALVFPAVVSFGLISVLFILQQLVGDIFALITGDDEKSRDALFPVMVGFFLSLASIPVFALIWGARVADLTEIYTTFQEGFHIGDTQISPTSFLLLAVIFSLGLLITRLLQGALKTSVLPKTKLDQGGQNAVVAGVGYVGIFLAGLIGINAAGIDLSGLAIIAGALSVGIGFGMQNIVSNFVAGIILLIERPVSEGDWIEVGGVQGNVRAISVRSTRIQTFDRTDVIVPNSDLISGVVTNWTRFSLSGRLIVKVGVAYGSDTRLVEKILQEIAEAQPLAVLNPPPNVALVNFGADSLDFEIRVILRDVNFSLNARSEINHEIVRRFAEAGIEIPFGQRDVWLRNPDALAQLLKGDQNRVPTTDGGSVPQPSGAGEGPQTGQPASTTEGQEKS